MINAINTALATLLAGVQLEGDDLFVTVLPHPATKEDGSDFAGFPSVSYYYETTDSDYSTVSENRRDLYFGIYIYGIWQDMELPDQYTNMYKMVDAVLDALDESEDLGINAIMLRPVPGEFRRIATERGEGLLARIRLRCSYDALIA